MGWRTGSFSAGISSGECCRIWQSVERGVFCCRSFNKAIISSYTQTQWCWQNHQKCVNQFCMSFVSEAMCSERPLLTQEPWKWNDAKWWCTVVHALIGHNQSNHAWLQGKNTFHSTACTFLKDKNSRAARPTHWKVVNKESPRLELPVCNQKTEQAAVKPVADVCSWKNLWKWGCKLASSAAMIHCCSAHTRTHSFKYARVSMPKHTHTHTCLVGGQGKILPSCLWCVTKQQQILVKCHKTVTVFYML